MSFLDDSTSAVQAGDGPLETVSILNYFECE